MMKRGLKTFFAFFFAPVFFAVTSFAGVYVNEKYGFSVLLAEKTDYSAIATKTDGDIGVKLKTQHGEIIIRPVQVEVDDSGTVEGLITVQSEFRTLVSSEPFTASAAIAGLVTKWEPKRQEYELPPGQVVLLGGRSDETSKPKQSYIFLLPLLKGGMIDGKYAQLLMIEAKSDDFAVARAIASSFKYLDYFKRFFSEEDNNDAFTVKQNAKLVAELRANPTTGYMWQTGGLDSSVFEINDITFSHDAKNSKAGSGGVSAITFTPLKKGVYVFTLPYSRSWEKKAPADVFTIKLTVE